MPVAHSVRAFLPRLTRIDCSISYADFLWSGSGPSKCVGQILLIHRGRPSIVYRTTPFWFRCPQLSTTSLIWV